MRHRWIVLLLVLGLLLSVTPVAAEVVPVDPEAEPEITLPQDEAQKLAALQSAQVAQPATLVGPDDQTLLVQTSSIFGGGVRWQFLNALTGVTVDVDPAALNYPPLTEIRWLDANTAVYPSLTESFDPILVALNKTSGQVITNTIGLPGFPVTLAPNASRLLIAAPVESESGSMSRQSLRRSPFDQTLQVAPALAANTMETDLAHEPPLLRGANRRMLQVSSQRIILASYDLFSGDIVPLTELPEGSGLGALAWTPDGGKLALMRYTLPTIDSGREPGRPGERLSELVVQDTLGNLAPNDNPFFQNNVVDLFDIAGGKLQPEAVKARDGNGDLIRDVEFSTDGNTLQLHMARPARLQGRRYPIYTFQFVESGYLRFHDANTLALLNVLDRPEIAAPLITTTRFLSPDELVIRTAYGLSERLYYYNRVSGEFRQASPEDGGYGSPVFTRATRQLIFTHDSLQRPYELFRVGYDGVAFADLTFNNEPIRALNQVQARHVTFNLRGAGRRTGILVQPAGAAFPPRNAPIVVWQEGGPVGGIRVGNAWGGNVENPYNLLPNFGISVLILPLQGREGYGPRNLNALSDGRNYGQIDIDDEAQAVQQMIARGYTSRGKVGIAGCSYGGYFVTQSITRYPNLYAAANSQCSLTDMFNEWQFGYTALISYLEGRTPTTDSAEYAKDSPINRSNVVRTPLLLFHGTRDFIPVAITDNFHDQVTKNGTPVRYLRFEGEGHGLAAPTSQFVAGQAQLEWFRQYLGK